MPVSAQISAFNYHIIDNWTWAPVQTSSFNAVAGTAYPVNTTSGAVTVTLPASPSAGNIVQITDYAGTFATYSCTINPNGGKIAGSTSSATFAVARESVALVYIDSTQGWVAYSAFIATSLGQIYTASYLTAAGGGGGGMAVAGGGGAGGLLNGTLTFNPGTVYSVVVGAGGTGATTRATIGSTGSNSSLTGISAAVGGGAGGNNNTTTVAASSGGSGGGGAGSLTGGGIVGSGTTGQGTSGGNGSTAGGGGGGGSGGAGGAGSGSNGGAGGAGTSNTITGSSVTYAGGGGGGAQGGTPGTTTGGGGAGSSNDLIGTAGTANTGGGGGGGGYSATGGQGGNGGSGVVIISVPTVNYTGSTTGAPTVTTSGSNTIMKFTVSGSYTA